MGLTGLFEGQQLIEGRPVKKFLFQKKLVVYVPALFPLQIVEVHAFNKDHAIERLEKAYPGVNRREWEFNTELEPQHFVGMLAGAEVLRLDIAAIKGEGIIIL